MERSWEEDIVDQPEMVSPLAPPENAHSGSAKGAAAVGNH